MPVTSSVMALDLMTGDLPPEHVDRKQAQEAGEGNGAASRSSSDRQLEELRRLLVSPERSKLAETDERLTALEKREIHVSADHVGELLPEAVIYRSKKDRQLASALAPTVEETLKNSVKRNPQPLVDAIFPVIGPAIRRAISEALSSTMDSVNRTMEHQFSAQGLRWRLEAFRTGRSFSEVVLSHSVLYSIEQVFVIENETGLPLVHVAQAQLETQDSALVSSMLSVVQDFVKDSLGEEQGAALETVEYGEQTIMIEPGPAVSLAAVVRGVPPRTLREHLQEMIEEFHMQYRAELEAYDGDTAPFESARPFLTAGLQTEYRESEKSSWKTGLLFGLIALVLAAWAFFTLRERARFDDYVATLDAQPGIVVTETTKRSGRWHVRGLRDPLAVEASEILAASAVDPDKVVHAWESYSALAPEIVARRAAVAMGKPETVRFTVEEGVLVASGSASDAWIREARAAVRSYTDVQGYDDLAVENTDVGRLTEAAEALNRTAIEFAPGSVRLVDEAVLDDLATALQAILADADRLGIDAQIEVRGYASPGGREEVNQRLSVERARLVAQVLVLRGIAEGRLSVRGMGVQISQDETQPPLAAVKVFLR